MKKATGRTVVSSNKLPSTRQYTGETGPGVPDLRFSAAKSLVRSELQWVNALTCVWTASAETQDGEAV